MEQHIPCLNYAFVYGFCLVLIRSAGRFYFVGALPFYENLQTHLGALLLGRVLLIGTLQYFRIFALSNWFLASQLGLCHHWCLVFFFSFNTVLISWKKILSFDHGSLVTGKVLNFSNLKRSGSLKAEKCLKFHPSCMEPFRNFMLC